MNKVFDVPDDNSVGMSKNADFSGTCFIHTIYQHRTRFRSNFSQLSAKLECQRNIFEEFIEQLVARLKDE